MATLTLDNFKGTNTEDENLASNVLPFSYNVDCSKGRLTKRPGYASLLDLGTTGSPKGIHTARFASGDTLVVGADDKAYKLSGTEYTEDVDTTTEFDLGTYDNTESYTISIEIDNSSSEDSTTTNYDLLGQTVDVSTIEDLSQITVRLDATTSENGTLTVYDTPLKGTTIGSKTTAIDSAVDDYDFIFDSDLDVSDYDSIYFEVEMATTNFTSTYYNTDYASGQAYFDGVAQSYDLRFSVYGTRDSVIMDEYFLEDANSMDYTLDTALDEFTAQIQWVFDLESGESETGELCFNDVSVDEQFRVYRRINESGTDIFKIYEFGVQVYTEDISGGDSSTQTIKVVKDAKEEETYFYLNDVLKYTSTTSFNNIKNIVEGNTGTPGDIDATNFYISYSLTGEYISKIIDLGQTPVANVLISNTTTSGEGTLSIYSRGSDDGVRFGNWGIATSGDSIPLKRYIQVRALFERTDLTVMSSASLDNFTISYTTAFDTKTQFDSGLTGNKIRWVNYQGQEYTALGTIDVSTSATTLTVDDATDFEVDQTIIIDGAGLSGADLTTTIDAISGTTITLTDSASEDITDGYVRIELFSSKNYVYYCDGTNVKKYDGTTVTEIETVPNSNIIYEHKNYMFYVPSIDPTRLYFSDIYGQTLANPLGDFELVDSTSYKKFPSEITAVKTFEGKLVVSGENFTAFVSGSIFGGDSDDTIVYIIDNIGAVNQESMTICTTSSGTILAITTNDGIRYLTGSSYENALQQAPLSDPVRTYIDNGKFDTAYSMYSDGKLYVGFNSGVVPADYIDSILVWDFTNGTIIDGVWNIALNDMCIFNNKLYGSSSDTTKLFELLSGEDDDGSDIEMIAVMRFDLGEYEATLHKMKIKATTDSDFDNATKCDIIVSADSHSRTLDLSGGRWRESTTYYTQYRGQDLMESKRSIKKRGTFVELNVVVTSSYKCEFDSFSIEYEGGRK